MTRPTRALWCAAVVTATIAVSIPVTFFVLERAERARRAADEPWRESPDWKGTYVSGVAVPSAVEKALLIDPPAPDIRRKHCEPLLSDLIGWRAVVDSVTTDGDGWNVALTVSPRIRSRLTYTNAKTVETWHVSAKGRARCDHCESGGSFFVIRD